MSVFWGVPTKLRRHARSTIAILPVHCPGVYAIPSHLKPLGSVIRAKHARVLYQPWREWDTTCSLVAGSLQLTPVTAVFKVPHLHTSSKVVKNSYAWGRCRRMRVIIRPMRRKRWRPRSRIAERASSRVSSSRVLRVRTAGRGQTCSTPPYRFLHSWPLHHYLHDYLRTYACAISSYSSRAAQSGAAVEGSHSLGTSINIISNNTYGTRLHELNVAPCFSLKNATIYTLYIVTAQCMIFLSSQNPPRSWLCIYRHGCTMMCSWVYMQTHIHFPFPLHCMESLSLARLVPPPCLSDSLLVSN